MNIPTHLCWDKVCLPKAGMFLWAALQKKDLTTNWFQKIGFRDPSRCSSCEENEETVDHLLLNCPYAVECWKDLIVQFGAGGNTTKQLRAQCRWEKPEYGWFKLKFDGAAQGNPGSVGIGCLMRHWSGATCARVAKPIGKTSNNIAEFEALTAGLLYSSTLGIKKLAIEGDSQIPINAIRIGNIANWHLKPLLDRALTIIRKFKHCTINHIYREGNSGADSLANLGVDGH
ncbi:uncharacterized protein LOC131856357 [Cryptomeria japonica]|uniref:uncharacterized protein LOC131856357 n=1 Tax=Cryptomeria japonica TaxID=3369 RepID=UPI0027DA7A82|nr:uncharacterized protein LOC131856357 [Cryptomeria japonica]